MNVVHVDRQFVTRDIFETFYNELKVNVSMLTKMDEIFCLDEKLCKSSSIVVIHIESMTEKQKMQLFSLRGKLADCKIIVFSKLKSDAMSFLKEVEDTFFYHLQDPDLFSCLRQSMIKESEDNNESELRSTTSQHRSSTSFIGISESTQELLYSAAVVSKTSATVLLRGESGVGKDVLARKIHEMSPRKSEAFVVVNCGAIPSNLLESELFGHKKGSFTGAISDKEGLFSKANKGTLFLDEIGDLPLSLQVKLLRAIQNKKIKPIGSTTEILIDVRIISATNKNLESMVSRSEFREDLFYRLNVFPVKISPLRKRKEDIEPFLRYFIKKYSMKYSWKPFNITNKYLKVCLNYNWPGNVRELENFVERSLIVQRGMSSELTSEILCSLLSDTDFDKPYQIENKTLVERPSHGKGISKELLTLKESEQNAIILALRHSSGNVNLASSILGVGVRTLYRKISSHNMNLKDYIR